MTPTLVSPSVQYRESYLEALREFHAEGRDLTQSLEEIEHDFDTFLRRVEQFERGENLPAGIVPESQFWLVEGDRFLGRVHIRHTLNDYLRRIGGHIGYVIRPSERRKGYGKLILKLALPKARALNLTKVFLTCLVENEASRKIIEACGGVFQDETPEEKGEPARLRYWIPLY